MKYLICVLSTIDHRGLVDYCAYTVPFLVHHLVLSSRSSVVAMTILADSEVRRDKLVSCFSNLILLLIDHCLGLN